jgi:hypothetical protein
VTFFATTPHFSPLPKKKVNVNRESRFIISQDFLGEFGLRLCFLQPGFMGTDVRSATALKLKNYI